jgi:hypothetical protein
MTTTTTRTTTKAELSEMAFRLAELTGLCVSIGRYSPGDGWTRYSVSVGDWQEIAGGMTAAETKAYLRGMIDILRAR